MKSGKISSQIQAQKSLCWSPWNIFYRYIIIFNEKIREVKNCDGVFEFVRYRFFFLLKSSILNKNEGESFPSQVLCSHHPFTNTTLNALSRKSYWKIFILFMYHTPSTTKTTKTTQVEVSFYHSRRRTFTMYKYNI